MQPVAFDPAFARHLEALGLAIGPVGVKHVHPETELEGPVSIYGADIWRDRVSIGAFSYVCPGSIVAGATVGRYCSIAEGVQIGMTGHPTDWLTTSPLSYAPDFLNFERHFATWLPEWRRGLALHDFEMRPHTNIGNDVWIGASVYIKDGVTIGDGAIIGAHSVVTKDVPAYAIVVGNPARVLRYRFPDALIERLAALRWWDYAILDFEGWDVRDVPGAVSALEDAVAAGAVAPYAPQPVNLVDEWTCFREAGQAA
ncbi:CatB-related O-acetyltransferase [Sphingomonas immobilis]|uniref:CatB-related O-acetyltransferase n=1 Tax=Sphingomonas immobilis TaxID=3063997 RepID=A0ABT8ZYS0_9SPHN|nr:CatB-related O-acetyltransferase [Sphingomonas sp. CA1-15]MDO7842730.1 CatB-related O-acetyltransferase [Sphingomonas sp. CA1-15]